MQRLHVTKLHKTRETRIPKARRERETSPSQDERNYHSPGDRTRSPPDFQNKIKGANQDRREQERTEENR